jgi:signal peptidase I
MSKRPEQRTPPAQSKSAPKPAPALRDSAAARPDASGSPTPPAELPAETGGGAFNWFLSQTVRHATHMRKHVWKLLCAQRDLLAPAAVDALTGAVRRMERACRATRDKKLLEAEMTYLENVANKWLRPYPNPAIRENVEVLLVAIAVAMAIRTFIAQPFKIPTGSMQPTLYGVTSVPDHTKLFESPETPFEIPNAFVRKLQFWWSGVGYTHVVATAPGQLEPVADVPKKFLLFNWSQSFTIGNQTYTVYFPPDRMLTRAGLIDRDTGRPIPRQFNAGDTVIKLKSFSGDHLFVDRLTYNFRRPKRGEIIVFETKNIPTMSDTEQGQFYIKRLVGLGGDKIQIGNDRHLIINGNRLDASTPRFEKVYSFDPTKPPEESQYSGHVNDTVKVLYGQYGRRGVARLFPTEDAVFTIPPDQYMVMGDNTLNSSDSRTWGSFPQQNVIGKNWCVYWPFGRQDDRPSRFGWGNR